MACSCPYCIDGSLWLYRCINYQFHIIIFSIRPQMFQLGGCLPRTATVVYSYVVHLLIVVHQRPRGWYVAYATTQPVPRSRYPTFNKVTVVCIYSVCTLPNKLVDKANRYGVNNVDDVYLPRLGGFTYFVEDNIMCMPHHTYNF